MKVRSAAVFFALAVAGATFAGDVVSPLHGRLFAQEPGADVAPPPIPPGPAPTPSPTPTPAPAPGRTGGRTSSSSGSISGSGTASIDQAYPLEYRSIIDRLRYDPDNPALLNEQGNYLVQH